jgi:phosphoesterase RecJ-like protein
VVGDCGELERIGPVLESHRELFERVPILDIDHHISNPRLRRVGLGRRRQLGHVRDGHAAGLADGRAAHPGDGMLASALAGGVVMDTGNFQHPNVTPRTLVVMPPRCGGRCRLERDRPDVVSVQAEYAAGSFGRVLARIASQMDGRLVWSTLELGDLAATGATSAESEGLVDLLSQSNTAEVAILFKEVAGNGSTRISVRTRDGGVDATRLTGQFGGGGHARAAGATLAMPVDEGRKAVLAAAAPLVAAVKR